MFVLRKRLKGLARRRTGMVWADSRRVVVFINRPIAVDIRTGRVTRVSNRYFGTRSADGRFVLETSKHGSQFAVSVVRIAGSRVQTYGLVGGCFDDGGPRAAVQSLQFVPGRKSLVFESYCPEPPTDLYAVAADGTALTKLTGGGKQYYTPVWSPDGTKIAYTRFDFRDLTCKGCPGSIWVADADGGNAHLLVPRQRRELRVGDLAKLVAGRDADPVHAGGPELPAHAVRRAGRWRDADEPPPLRLRVLLGADADRLDRHRDEPDLAVDREARRERSAGDRGR